MWSGGSMCAQRPGGPGSNPVYSSFFEGFSNHESTYERPKSRKRNKKDQRLQIEDGSTQAKAEVERDLFKIINNFIVPLLIKKIAK